MVADRNRLVAAPLALALGLLLLACATVYVAFVPLRAAEHDEITVVATAPGRAAPAMTETLVRPLENALRSTPEVEHPRSLVTHGWSSITATLACGADRSRVLAGLQRRLAAMAPPEEVKVDVAIRRAGRPAMTILLTRGVPAVADVLRLRDVLAQVPGCDRVVVAGLERPSIAVTPLQAERLARRTTGTALAERLADTGRASSGVLREGATFLLLTVAESAQSARDVAALRVTGAGGEVAIGAIARVEPATIREGAALRDDRPGVALLIYRTAGTDALVFDAAARRALARVAPSGSFEIPDTERAALAGAACRIGAAALLVLAVLSFMRPRRALTFVAVIPAGLAVLLGCAAAFGQAVDGSLFAAMVSIAVGAYAAALSGRAGVIAIATLIAACIAERLPFGGDRPAIAAGFARCGTVECDELAAARVVDGRQRAHERTVVIESQPLDPFGLRRAMVWASDADEIEIDEEPPRVPAGREIRWREELLARAGVTLAETDAELRALTTEQRLGAFGDAPLVLRPSQYTGELWLGFAPNEHRPAWFAASLSSIASVVPSTPPLERRPAEWLVPRRPHRAIVLAGLLALLACATVIALAVYYGGARDA